MSLLILLLAIALWLVVQINWLTVQLSIIGAILTLFIPL